MIDIICATKLTENEFWLSAPLGISLRRLAYDKRLNPRPVFTNRLGLPEIYNKHILDDKASDILVFVHDDVWIDDFFLSDRVIQGLKNYDILGVAGNRRRVQNQPSWYFKDTRFSPDESVYLSGSVAHGKSPFGQVSFFGPASVDCELLDGVFLAASTSSLLQNKAIFDQRFDFHFYDLDFCRNARQRGLRLGTWPICLTHQSGGAFGSEQWHENYRVYIEKWGY